MTGWQLTTISPCRLGSGSLIRFSILGSCSTAMSLFYPQIAFAANSVCRIQDPLLTARAAQQRHF